MFQYYLWIFQICTRLEIAVAMRLVPECVLYLASKTSTPHRQIDNRILAMPPREASVPARGRGRPNVLPRNDTSPGSSNSSAALLSGMQSPRRKRASH